MVGLKKLPAIISLIAAFLGIVVSFIVYLDYTRRSELRKESARELIIESLYVDNLEDNLAALLAAKEKLSVALSEAKKLPKGYPAFASLAARLDKLELDLKGFKKLLFDNPEASVTIPLIKKDIELIKEDNKRLREEMVKMNDLTKWLIGLMVTISIGLFGLTISILLKERHRVSRNSD